MDITNKIREDIENCKNRYGKKWGMYFFNNFDANLSGGRRREFTQSMNLNIWADCKDASEKKKRQTVAEFIYTIDSIIEKLNIDPQEIIDARKRFDKERDWSMFDIFPPIYIELTKLGYNDHDLTG